MIFSKFAVPFYILAVLLAAIAIWYLLKPDYSVEIAKAAYQSYQTGEKTNDAEMREKAFNQALALYAQLEKEKHPVYGDGKLYYNIANTYFELGQYPYAALYYYRAEALRPKDLRVENNLKTTLKKLRVAKPENSESWAAFIFLHTLWPLPLKLKIFTLLFLLFFALWSLQFWFPNIYTKTAAYFLLIPILFLALSLLYAQFFAPIEGILVQASSLYRDAGVQYAKVLESPLAAGQKVTILDAADGGKWFKVVSQDGSLGFLPKDAVQVI